jgi:hypothetical protein
MMELRKQLAQFQTDKVPTSDDVLHALCMLKPKKLKQLYQATGTVPPSR